MQKKSSHFRYKILMDHLCVRPTQCQRLHGKTSQGEGGSWTKQHFYPIFLHESQRSHAMPIEIRLYLEVQKEPMKGCLFYKAQRRYESNRSCIGPTCNQSSLFFLFGMRFESMQTCRVTQQDLNFNQFLWLCFLSWPNFSMKTSPLLVSHSDP